jgi:hypothetical protein
MKRDSNVQDAMANNSITLSTLDFDSIKENLKNHLRSQSIFKDYDFDGSNMAVLLDVLAYNTSLNATYMNMLASESFLDSAQMRSSVVSHAKELNYRPRSARSAVATIKLNVEQTNSNVLTIPKGTTFTSIYNLQTFSFTTDSVQVFFAPLNANTGTYKFETTPFDIYEGFYVTENFAMDYSNETQRFILSNELIDTTSLVVNSIEDSGTVVNYILSDTLLGLDKNSKKYFLQATEDDKYEILFGDDILGRKPKDGALIQIQYRISSGDVTNGAASFIADSDLTSDSSGRVTVTTITAASGGEVAESLDSIKYNAPRHFQTQERAVSDTDYEDLLKISFPEIQAISVYGGENVNPPAYGKVFIALSISGVDGIPESKRQQYYSYIKPKMVGPMQPVFVNPTYLFCRVDSGVTYNLNVTTLKPDEISLLVAAAISKYNDTNLNDFNSTLFNSKFARAIDESHSSILSNDTECRVYKKIYPTLGVSQSFDVLFGLPIRSDIPKLESSHSTTKLKALFSSPFTYNNQTCIIEDDGNGILRLMTATNSDYNIVKEVGTIDYASGKLQITNLNVDKYEGTSIRIYVLPASRDIVSAKNDIFRIELDEVNIQVEATRQ